MKIVLGLIAADAVVAVQVVLHLDPEDSSVAAHGSKEALIAAPDADCGQNDVEWRHYRWVPNNIESLLKCISGLRFLVLDEAYSFQVTI